MTPWFSVGDQVVIVRSGNVNVRSSPGYKDKLPKDSIYIASTNEEFKITGGPQFVDEIYWWKVKNAFVAEGWIAQTTNKGDIILGYRESHIAQEISAEQAIKSYYSLIEQQQYKLAYEMLSESHRISATVPTLDRYVSEWKKSGPATIIEPIKTNGDGNNAALEFTVYYYCREGRAYHRFRYTLKRNVGCDNPQFGCWLVQRVDEVPISFTRVLYLTSPRMNGEDVQTVQYKLLCLGYKVGEVDGYLGPNTESAIRHFQAANGLNVDGVVGQLTWQKLLPVLKP